jgi:hypothetical protein
MPYKDPERQREYMRQWVASRRAEWLAMNGPCVDCKSWADLEVDHVDASAKVTHRVWSWSKVRREAELAKCVVRCTSCHQKKTLAAGEVPRGEGNGMAKLTAGDVLLIRSSLLSLRVLAVQLKVDYSLVWQVRARKIWQHI